jgi:hypothetical protein
VHVHVGGAGNDAGRRGQELRDLEPRAERQEDEQRRAEQREMTHGPRRRVHAAHGMQAHFAAEHVGAGGGRGGENQGEEQHPVHQFEHRQREDVEADVTPEDRIDAPERRGIQVIEPRLPPGTGEEPDEQRHQARAGEGQRPDRRRVDEHRLRTDRRRHDEAERAGTARAIGR